MTAARYPPAVPRTEPMPRRLPESRAARYGFAVVCVVAGTAARLALDPVFGDLFPFFTVFLGVLLAAWYGGSGPAVAATLLGAFLAARFILPPRGEFAVSEFGNQA